MPPQAENQEIIQDEPKKKRGRIAIIAISVLILIAAGWWFWNYSGLYYKLFFYPKMKTSCLNSGGTYTGGPPIGWKDLRINEQWIPCSCPGDTQWSFGPEYKCESVTENWKTYRNEEYGFEFKYPADFPDFRVEQFSNKEEQNDETYTIPGLRFVINNTEIKEDFRVFTLLIWPRSYFDKFMVVSSSSSGFAEGTVWDKRYQGEPGPSFLTKDDKFVFAYSGSQDCPEIYCEARTNVAKILSTFRLMPSTSSGQLSTSTLQTFKIPDPKNLPPDPGETGKKTLAGIDSDNDGLRDDLQRWIALNYSASAKTRAGLYQYVQNAQNMLLFGATPEIGSEFAIKSSEARWCLQYILGFSGAEEARQEVLAKLLNTRARTITYNENYDRLGGPPSTTPGRADKSQFCKFDLNSLPD